MNSASLGLTATSVISRWPPGSLQRLLQPSLSTMLPSSHSSPVSTVPLPQHVGIGACSQTAVHVAAAPVMLSIVHLFLSSQSAALVGQAPGFPARIALSHFSPVSTFLLPQRPASTFGCLCGFPL